MAIARITEARLRLIRKRQWKDNWGKDYVPATWATPQEAPGISKATILHPAKLGGRPFHTLSPNETWTALLALLHRDVWDIHEQRVLFPEPRPNFLFGHPKAKGEHFPPFKGTLDVCERMGILERHPKCRVKLNADGEQAMAPFPYQGDLLVFLQDLEGVYAVNLTVKDKVKSFRRHGPKAGKPQSDRDDLSAIDRHSMEEQYYEDAGIPTRQVAGESIDFDLRCNLHDLFLSHAEQVAIPVSVQGELYQYFQERVGSSATALQLVVAAARRLEKSESEILTVLKQAIWQRQVRVDLFRPFLVDKRLRPEVDDPLVVYGGWFSRG